MEKINYSFENLKKKRRFINWKLIEIKPYISLEDVLLIKSIFKDLLLNDKNIVDVGNSITNKCLYDILVVYFCTNIKIQKIYKNIKDEENVSLDLNFEYEFMQDFYNSRFINKIKKYIKNYEEVWLDINSYIDRTILLSSLGFVSSLIPNNEDMSKTINDLRSLLDELNKKNPNIIPDLLKVDALNRIGDTKKNNKDKKKEN